MSQTQAVTRSSLWPCLCALGPQPTEKQRTPPALSLSIPESFSWVRSSLSGLASQAVLGGAWREAGVGVLASTPLPGGLLCFLEVPPCVLSSMVAVTSLCRPK